MSHHVSRTRPQRRWTAVAATVALTATSLAAGTISASAHPGDGQPTVDGAVHTALAADGGTTEFLVHLREAADLSAASGLAHRTDRAAYVHERLTSVAEASQAPLRADLDARGVPYTSFWIANALLVEGDRELLDELATRPEVSHIEAHTHLTLSEPDPQINQVQPEWNITDIGAPHAWNVFGATGRGAVVATIGTGAEYDHPALVRQYRGTLLTGFDHHYNWFDATGSCPTAAPCDDSFLSTHNLGVMVGDDGVDNRIGVAPDAQWIAAKACTVSICPQSALFATAQWMIAPTDLNGQNPDPSKAPHVISSSWGGAPASGGWFFPLIDAWVAAGILPVFAAGSSGPGCGSVGSPGDHPDVYAVGAYDINHDIASFSGRGPSQVDGVTIKPNAAAPGASIRSSIPGGGYATFTGTGFAAPHAAGVAALVWSERSSLIGNVTLTRQILDATAVSVNDVSCGGSPANNNVWGQGRLDAFQAVWLARTL
jgi:hypothetical protein